MKYLNEAFQKSEKSQIPLTYFEVYSYIKMEILKIKISFGEGFLSLMGLSILGFADLFFDLFLLAEQELKVLQ